jgi:hypothetical protein
MRIRRRKNGTFFPAHGDCRDGKISPECQAYHRAKTRCRNPHVDAFKYYGARGIKFRFKTFREFLNEVGRKPSPEYVLDRIDNDGHYEIGNVKWATKSESSKNRRKTPRFLRAVRKSVAYAYTFLHRDPKTGRFRR